jgi:hypothetical protein
LGSGRLSGERDAGEQQGGGTAEVTSHRASFSKAER